MGDTSRNLLLMSPAIPTSCQAQCASCSFGFCLVLHELSFFSLTLHSELHKHSHIHVHNIHKKTDTHIQRNIQRLLMEMKVQNTDRQTYPNSNALSILFQLYLLKILGLYPRISFLTVCTLNFFPISQTLSPHLLFLFTIHPFYHKPSLSFSPLYIDYISD